MSNEWQPSDEATRRAAEAMEDAAMRWLGRDLGTLHRDDIAREVLAAAYAVDGPKRDQAVREQAFADCRAREESALHDLELTVRRVNRNLGASLNALARGSTAAPETDR